MLSVSKKWGLIILAVIMMLAVSSLSYADTTSKIFPDGLYADVQGYGCASSTGTGKNGWDIDEIELRYDDVTDILHVRISMWNDVIAGDIDNNGNPGTQQACFAPWQDDPNLGGPAGLGEAIDFIIDTGLDDTFDYIAGVSNSTDITGFAVVNYDTTDTLNCPATPVLPPGNCYGTTPWVHGGGWTNNPSAGNPDFEFDIYEFADMLGKPVTVSPQPNFNFTVRTGKLLDGTGEDYFQFTGQPTAVTLSSLTARSSTGSLASGLWLGVAGFVVLVAVGSLLWMKRRAI